MLFLPSCLGQETAKGPFDLRIKLLQYLSDARGGGITPFFCIAEPQEGKP